MELDENSLMNIPNLRRSKRIIQKVNKLNNINKITKAHIHSPQKKKIKKVIKKNIDKTINARSTIESDNLTEVSTPISSLKLNNKRKEISRKYSNKDDNDCTPKIIRNKTKISKKANVSISKNLKSLTPKPNAQKKNPIHLRNTKSFIDKVKSSSDTTSTNNNFNFYSNVEQDNDFGNNNLDYMMKLATDIDAFRSHFERFDELTKNNNIVFSKNNDNKLIPKEVEFNDDDLSSSPSHSCNIFTETTTHIISSDTGLATSMESFQLLSSDPVEPEDSFWLPKSLTSFNNQNSVSPNQSLKSFNDKETSFLKDKNSNNNLFTPFNSNIFDNSNKSDTFNEEENDATPIKSYKSSNIFLNYEFSKQKKDITPSINTSNIFLNYELTKQEKNKTTIDNLFLNCFHEDSQNSFNDNLEIDFNSQNSILDKPILLEKSESLLLSEDTKNLEINAKDNKLEKAKPGLYIVGGNENMTLGLGENITEVPVFTQIKCLADVEYVSSGEDYCFAIESVKIDDSEDINYIWSFGNNTYGTLGYPGNHSTPKKVNYFNKIKIVQIFCGPEVCIFRSAEGSLYLTGTYTDNSNKIIKTKEPIRLSQFEMEVIDVAASKGYIYVISKDHKFYYWNYNKNLAHLKLFNDDKKDNQEVIEYSVLHNNKKIKFNRVFSGKYHTFLLDEEKHVYGFGANQWGQLGTTFDTDEEEPVLIKELIQTPIKEIACGNFHSLFLSESGNVFACGKNDRYQIGFNSESGSILSPKELKPIKNCVHIACGANHSMAIVNNNYYSNFVNNKHETTTNNKIYIEDVSDSLQYILYGWGDGESYNLGTGSNTCKNILKSIDFKIFVNKYCRPRKVAIQLKSVEAGNGFTLLLTK